MAPCESPLALVTCLLGLAAGCSSTTSASPEGGTNASSGACGAAPSGAGTGDGAACVTHGLPVDTFAVGMMKAGVSGNFDFQIAKADPCPPNDPQANTWTIRVLDKAGHLVSDAAVTLPGEYTALGWRASRDPWMPVMNHGSPIVNTITKNADGTTDVIITFNMSGLWQTFLVAQSGSMTDGAMFSFCLP